MKATAAVATVAVVASGFLILATGVYVYEFHKKIKKGIGHIQIRGGC